MSPIFGSCSAARCPSCSRLTACPLELCHSCQAADSDPEQFWTWGLLREMTSLGYLTLERCDGRCGA